MSLFPIIPYSARIVTYTLFIPLLLLYYVRAESSAKQATWGKRLFNLKVTDENRQRISFWRSLVRIAGIRLTTSFRCGYGLFMVCTVTPQKQCLHDQLAKCLVLDTNPNEKNILAIVTSIIVPILVTIAPVIHMQSTRDPAPSEQTYAKQAIPLLESVHQAQRNYHAQNNRYAIQWNQLKDFQPCVNEYSNTCYPSHFILKLEKGGVSAQRSGSRMLYRLFLSYDSQNSKQNITCTELNSKAKGICSSLDNLSAPQSPNLLQ